MSILCAGFSRWHGVLVAALLITVSAQAGSQPKWLVNASRQPTPEGVGDAPAVVLLDETTVAIDSNGRTRTERHYVVRILTRVGLDYAAGSFFLEGKGDWVDDSSAWLLRDGKDISPTISRKWAEQVVEDAGGIYSETRQFFISYSDIAFPGDVFAFSAVVERSMLVCQERFTWDPYLPLVMARSSVSLPSGWKLSACTKGPAAPAYSVSPNGLIHTWELANQPYRPAEAWSAPVDDNAATILLTFLPPPGAKAPPTFQKWSEVVAYQARLASGQCDTDATLAGTATKLTAGCPDPVAKLRALGTYVQKLRYVEISRDLKLGFGYRPRKATEVLAKGFGDCKDKANLLAALLHEVGVRSYPAIAQSTDDGNAEIFPEWPSPYQFNHMILAVEVDPKTGLPSVVKTPQLGSLLFFDPTNSETEVGDIPWYLQGTRVQVLAPDNNELTTLPDLPVEKDYATQRTYRLQLNDKGAVTGEGSIVSWGQEGARRRGFIRRSTTKERRDSVTEMLGSELRMVSLDKLETIDNDQTGQAGLSLSFSAPNFVQQLSGGLAIVRLTAFGHDKLSKTFSAQKRNSSLVIRPEYQTDEIILALPPVYQVDEVPKPASIQTSFGSYERVYELKDGGVVSRRTFRLNKLVVPPSEYPAFRKFIYDVAKCDRSTVVLRQRT
jgi:Domain of Unknown Function with PDB structure (DUF3857)/Transglutaminase-like superfamily